MFKNMTDLMTIYPRCTFPGLPNTFKKSITVSPINGGLSPALIRAGDQAKSSPDGINFIKRLERWFIFNPDNPLGRKMMVRQAARQFVPVGRSPHPGL